MSNTAYFIGANRKLIRQQRKQQKCAHSKIMNIFKSFIENTSDRLGSKTIKQERTFAVSNPNKVH